MTELLANLALGFETALSPVNLAFCFVGVFLGTFIGVLPGIGSLAAVSMLLPISYHLEPTTAVVMLAGIFYGAEYGGAIAAILLRLPGTPSSAVVCLDGYPLAQQGRAGIALMTSMLCSFTGGTIGIIVLIAFSPALSEFALSFGSADYFALMLLGLIAAAAVTQGTPVKGIAMVVVGLMLGSVGTDVSTGLPRLTFGIPELMEGISLVSLAMGLFGVSELLASIGTDRSAGQAQRISLRSMIPQRKEIRRAAFPAMRGTAIGAFFGALPGTGQTVASFVSYAVEKRISRDPSRFGNGAIEGVAAPEASNNAAVQTSFIPTLTLGVPGSATMALMLGALMIHGIVPGPLLVTDHPDVFWGLVASFWFGNIFLLVLNIPLIGLWVWLLKLPYRFLYPAILILICIGVYSVSNSLFDVWLVLGFGIIGYAMRLLDFEPAPLLIGFVLGPAMEENLRRGLRLADGDIMQMFARPISGTLLAISVVLLTWSLISSIKQRR